MMAESDWIVIPARYDSSRLPGKPLADIGGRPMIDWVYERAVAAGAEQVVIATDDERIQEAAAEIGARAVLTSEGHESGTDRLAEVIDFLELPDETVVVNLQGDEPMMPPVLLAQVANLLRAKPEAAMATLMVPILDKHEFLSPDAVKVVANARAEAMYFSRAPIPFTGMGCRSRPRPGCSAFAIWVFMPIGRAFCGVSSRPSARRSSVWRSWNNCARYRWARLLPWISRK